MLIIEEHEDYSEVKYFVLKAWTYFKPEGFINLEINIATGEMALLGFQKYYFVKLLGSRTMEHHFE
jgi:hypothetical protein